MKKIDNAEFNLRGLIDFRFAELWEELEYLRGLLENMEKFTITRQYEVDMIKTQIAGLAEKLHDLEIRTVELEKHAGLATWLVRQSLTILAVIVGVVLWSYLT